MPTLPAAERVDLFIVHSYSQEYPWTRRQHEGFLDTLERGLDAEVVTSVEYLDTKRADYDESYARLLAGHLARKYAGYSPDVVYLTDDNALAFAREHLAELFPEAPMFFSGVNDYGVEAYLDRDRFTGVFERKEIAPNLELMRRLAEDVRDIVVIGDGSGTYESIAKEVRAELAERPGIAARFVADSRLSVLLDGLRQGDEEFAFLTTLGALTDARGRTLPLERSIAAIVALDRFTVISMEDVYVVRGVTGGWVTSGTRQGQAAARLVLRHLQGEPVAAIAPIHDSPNEYLIDAAVLRRDGRELPEDIAAKATVLNPAQSFYERHQGLLVGSLYALAAMFMVLLCATLVLVLRKNRAILAASRSLESQVALTEEVRDSLTRAQAIAGMGNWDWRVSDNRFFLSDGMRRLLGDAAGEVESSYDGFMARVHADDREAVSRAVREALSGAGEFELLHRMVLEDGTERTVWETAEVVVGADGVPERMIGTVLDVTDREETARALRESEARLRTLIEGLPVALLMFDVEGRLLLAEGSGLESAGVDPDRLLGRSLVELQTGRDEVREDLKRVLAGETFACTRWLGDLAFEMRYSPLRGGDGALTGGICVAVDVTERKRSEDRLSFLANYDPVTHLPNRFLFSDRLAHSMKSADRNRARVGLLFVDLDNFKTINDTLGHAEGDELLKQVAARLSSVVRATDTVSRLGGDEFTVIVENLARDEEAAGVAAKILEQSEHPYLLNGTEVYLTPSIGLAVYPRDGADVDTLVMNADAAMYRAKENGRNGFQFFTREINARALQRLEVSNLLRGALDRGEMSLHYQPKVELRSERVIGFEALLRWTSRRRGPVSPAEFVPILEETGLIVPVGAWVLREACRWAAQLPNLDGEPVSISVNLSARQFREPDLHHTVGDALVESGLAAGRLELEITESSLVDLETNLQTMERLKCAGVRLSIDDFGTGYSSLSYLKRFPVDRLKIDASFVRDVAVDADDAAIVTAIVGLAHTLGLRVIAEGVEQAEQVQYLRSERCDEVQGYLIARPMPGDEAVDWLRRWQVGGLVDDGGHPPSAAES